ncbi:thioredoxin domain-containing protein, putative [Eimeria maxima]|uniref:Thioredoxin domain-containing protein, putative n=1 Tax=Eimeria maxima TaxID=5804 RepID=U6M1J0_EIMMA|nr:thioredoxin domain-containing protein, putative [Eimeria maxima]CDJ56324.1 thioredoxin domain-containing protein, putative [Eimeria maxima]
MTRLFPLLLHLAAAAATGEAAAATAAANTAAANAANAAAAAAANEPHSVRTPEQQSCPANSLKEEFSYLSNPPSDAAAAAAPAAAAANAANAAAAAAPAAAAPEAAAPASAPEAAAAPETAAEAAPAADAAAADAAAETAAAAAAAAGEIDIDESSDYVELTEEALQIALQKRPTALVLLADSRCTDTSGVSVVASTGRSGIRQGEKRDCDIFLRYQQNIPKPAAAAAATAAAAAAAAEKEKEEQEQDYLSLFFPDNATEEEIKLQIIKLAYPPSLRATSKKLLDELLFEFPTSLVRLFPSPGDVTPVPAGVLAAATRLPIIDVDDPDVASSFNVKPPSQLLLRPKGFRQEFAMDGDEEQMRLTRALEEEPKPIVVLNTLNAPSIFTELRPVVFFFGGSEPAIAEETAFMDAAGAWDKSVLFCLSSSPSILRKRAFSYLGIKEEYYPQVIIVRHLNDPKKTQKFICPNSSTKEEILHCLTLFKEKKLSPYYKSEKPPKVQKGPVYDLVASRYKSVVLESNKDVLLLVYSPYCPHSAAFMPVFEEVSS